METIYKAGEKEMIEYMRTSTVVTRRHDKNSRRVYLFPNSNTVASRPMRVFRQIVFLVSCRVVW